MEQKRFEESNSNILAQKQSNSVWEKCVHTEFCLDNDIAPFHFVQLGVLSS